MLYGVSTGGGDAGGVKTKTGPVISKAEWRRKERTVTMPNEDENKVLICISSTKSEVNNRVQPLLYQV